MMDDTTVPVFVLSRKRYTKDTTPISDTSLFYNRTLFYTFIFEKDNCFCILKQEQTLRDIKNNALNWFLQSYKSKAFNNDVRD